VGLDVGSHWHLRYPGGSGGLGTVTAPLDQQKWFQVTHQAVRSPTGMHSQNLACSVVETLSSCSPLPLLHGLGSVLQNPSAFSTC
jgi:hypothetical protein